MKNLLILLAAITLIGCEKAEDTTLSQEDQEIENAKLIGGWEGIDGYDKHSMIITESFEMTLIYPNGNEVYCKYHLGADMIVLDEGEYFDWGRILYYYLSDSGNTLWFSNKKNVRYVDRYWQRTPPK